MNRLLHISSAVLLLPICLLNQDSACGQEDGLVLTINRADGSATIDNPGASTVELDLYIVQSDIGAIDPVGWLSLDQQGVAGDTWKVTGNPPTGTANEISELNPDTSSSLAPSSMTPIGSLFAPVFTEFGQDSDDLIFTYGSPGEEAVVGEVQYTGDKQYNNIVLTVDPNTGEATMQNESEIAVSIDSYQITSTDDALLSGNGQWSSLQDQGIGGGDWFEAGSVGPALLSELQQDGVTFLAKGNGFSLGTIFDTAKLQELEFQFILAGEASFFPGAVVFGDLPTIIEGVPGDFDGNNVVNGLDYLNWQRGESPNPGSSSDLAEWRANYGAGASLSAISHAVPEPTVGTMFALASTVMLFIRRRAIST